MYTNSWNKNPYKIWYAEIKKITVTLINFFNVIQLIHISITVLSLLRWSSRVQHLLMWSNALSHLHVLMWRPEDVLGVHWKLPDRGGNAKFYHQTGFTGTHRVERGDRNTSVLRHLASLSRSSSVYPVLTKSRARFYRDYSQVHAASLEFAPRLQRPHYVCTTFLTFCLRSKRDQTSLSEALSQHVTFCSE